MKFFGEYYTSQTQRLKIDGWFNPEEIAYDPNNVIEAITLKPSDVLIWHI